MKQRPKQENSTRTPGWVLIDWTGGDPREVDRFLAWEDANRQGQKIGEARADFSIEDATTWDRVHSVEGIKQ